MAKKKFTPGPLAPRQEPAQTDHLERAREHALRARTLMELLEELAGSSADVGADTVLKLEGCANSDVLVTSLSTIRGHMQSVERHLDAVSDTKEVRRG